MDGQNCNAYLELKDCTAEHQAFCHLPKYASKMAMIVHCQVRAKESKGVSLDSGLRFGAADIP